MNISFSERIMWYSNFTGSDMSTIDKGTQPRQRDETDITVISNMSFSELIVIVVVPFA